MRQIDNEKGVTLLELLVALAVLAIVASTAVPSAVELIRNNRATAQANDFLAALSTTRSEAIKRRANISLCSSDDQAVCGGTWQDGWIIVDSFGSVLQAHEPLSGDSVLASLVFTNAISYRANGFAQSNGADTAGTFVLSIAGTPSRDINVSRTGSGKVTHH